MTLTWWLWLLFGIVLLLAELITPGGFYIFFFGIGAVVVGLLAFLGFAGPPWLQWLLFGVLSTLALALFRGRLQRRLQSQLGRTVDTMIGETAVALADIEVQQVGKAELRGSPWAARNVGDEIIKAGQRCQVERMEGLMLYIRG